MAATNRLGLKGCEVIYQGLKQRYQEESLRINEIGTHLAQIEGEDGKFRDLQIKDLTFEKLERMSFGERSQTERDLMIVAKKIKELEERAFELLQDLFEGAERLDEEVGFCHNKQEVRKLENWGHELLDDEEAMEKFIDELDFQTALFEHAVRSIGFDVCLNKQHHRRRWWHETEAKEEAPKKKLQGRNVLDLLNEELKSKARRSLESLKDLEIKKRSPREYLEMIPIHFSDDDVDAFQSKRRENKKSRKAKKE